MQIKIFYSRSLDYIEKAVNEYIAEFDDELYSFDIDYGVSDIGYVFIVECRKRRSSDWNLRKGK